MRYLLLLLLPFANFANEVMIEARFIEDDSPFTEAPLVIGPEVVTGYLTELGHGTDVLSAPKITVPAGQKGRIKIGEENGNGVFFAVTARVSDDRKAIALDLHAKVVEGDSIRETRSSVTMPDGHTVALGGMSSEDILRVSDRLPLLGALPVLGRLFRHDRELRRIRHLTVLVSARLLQ
jgi:Flp pilus assembly secretin CpaC